MAEADKDGRMAQVVADLMETTRMSVNESVRDSVAEYERLLAEFRGGQRRRRD